MTLYFAKEVPLTVNQFHRLSDSAPLLDDTHQNGFDLSNSKPDMPIVDNAKGNNNAAEKDVNLTQVNSKVEDHQNETFSDGPGAVLVNLLTSLRHLQPAMHSVLIVMALSWVSASVVISTFPFLCFPFNLVVSQSPIRLNWISLI